MAVVALEGGRRAHEHRTHRPQPARGSEGGHQDPPRDRQARLRCDGAPPMREQGSPAGWLRVGRASDVLLAQTGAEPGAAPRTHRFGGAGRACVCPRRKPPSRLDLRDLGRAGETQTPRVAHQGSASPGRRSINSTWAASACPESLLAAANEPTVVGLSDGSAGDPLDHDQPLLTSPAPAAPRRRPPPAACTNTSSPQSP